MNLNQQQHDGSNAGRTRGDSRRQALAGRQDTPVRGGGLFDLMHYARLGADYAGAQPTNFIPDTSLPTVARRSRVDGCANGVPLRLTRQRQTRVGERSTWRCIYRAIRPSHQLIQIPRMYQGRSVRVARQGVECLTALRPVAKFSRVALQGNAAQFGHHAPDSMSDVPHSTNVLSTYPVAYVQTHRAAGGRKIGTRVQRA